MGNRKLQILVLLLAVSISGFAQMPEMLSDIVSGKYKAKSLPGFTNMPDGEHYAQLTDNKILAYSFATGQVTDTLFDSQNTKITKIENVDGFVLAPTDKYLLVYNNAKKIYCRSFTADWYIYNRQRKELKPLSEQMPVASPVFSPNGRYIAFSRDNNLFIHKLDYGTEVAVTTDGSTGKIINGTPDWLYEEEFSTTCLYSFSPDSKQLAFVRLDESEVPEFTWQEFLEGKYPENFSLKYPKSGENNAKASVVAYDIQYKSLKTIALTSNSSFVTDYIPRIRWTNSPDALAVFVLNRNQNKLEMYVANPRSAVAQLVYTEKSGNYCIDYEQIDQWQFLSDNNMIVVNETDGYRNAYLYTVNGQKLKQLTNDKYDIMQVYGYDEASSTLYYQAADRNPMTRYVYALNTKKNKVQCLTPEQGTHNAVFSSTFKYMIDNYSSVTHANLYTLYNTKGKKLRELLNNEECERKFNLLQPARKRFFTFTTSRGDMLNAWVILPDVLEKLQSADGSFNPNMVSVTRYPVLLVQYSGPASQQVLDVWKPDWEYFLAKQDIIVVCADGRGTNARGTDWRAETYMNLGEKEAQDQVETAQYMASLSCVNAERIGIWGWSYGGYMTIRAMSEPQAVFCCGIAVAPVTDWNLYDSAYTERFMRRPQENEDGFNNASVIPRASDLHGRLLLCHGLADDNVHCQQAWKYVDALVEAGVQFDMQIYPDDNHFLRKRSNYTHLYNRKWEFLQQWLKK